MHISRFVSRCTRAAIGAGLVAAGGVLAITPAHATTVGPNGAFDCTSSDGHDYTCTAPVGADTAFTVPAGVHVLVVDVVGAWGGSEVFGPGPGGRPAELTAHLMVGPGEQAFFAVGTAGGAVAKASGAAMPGGFNGGGPTRASRMSSGAGGGGASDVRFGNDSLGARVLVAAGGGGAGGQYRSAGANHDASTTQLFGGQSGHVADNGGVSAYNHSTAGDGSFGQGGTGTNVVTNDLESGGGGGGGYGGGGGGDPFGGGGGSSYLNYATFASPGTPAPLTDATTPAGSNGSITFTYSQP